MQDGNAGWTGGKNPWVIAMVVSMATFMEILDTSIANVSLPHIAGSMGVARSESTWVLTSYLVANAVALPISGWLSLKLGRKRYYMLSVAVFTAASLLCGLTPSLGWLVFFRVVQGLSGGGLGPCEQAILVDTFPAAKRTMAMAIYGMTAVLAPAIGPTLGGAITDHASWRWVFFINIPIGIASLVLTSRIITDPPHLEIARARSRGIDGIGLSLIAVGLGVLELVLDKGQEEGWFDSPVITAASILAAVALGAFVIWEWRHPYPIVDVRLFKDRGFAVANVLMLALGFTSYGSTVMLPQFLQALLGYTAEQSGMVLSPGGFVILVMLPIAARLVTKVDPRVLIAAGFAAVSLVLFHMARTLGFQVDFATAVELRCLQCIGMGCLFVPIQTIVYASVSPEKRGEVSGVTNLARNMGGDIGIAFLTTLIARRRQFHQVSLAAHLTAYDLPLRAHLGGAARALVMAGSTTATARERARATLNEELLMQSMQLSYLDAIWAIGVMTALMVLLVWLVHPPTPRVTRA